MLIRGLFIFGLFFRLTVGHAEPAPYYWWVSQFDGARVCSQIPLGEGWVMEPTPFKDARCRVRLYKQ